MTVRLSLRIRTTCDALFWSCASAPDTKKPQKAAATDGKRSPSNIADHVTLRDIRASLSIGTVIGVSNVSTARGRQPRSLALGRGDAGEAELGEGGVDDLLEGDL